MCTTTICICYLYLFASLYVTWQPIENEVQTRSITGTVTIKLNAPTIWPITWWFVGQLPGCLVWRYGILSNPLDCYDLCFQLRGRLDQKCKTLIDLQSGNILIWCIRICDIWVYHAKKVMLKSYFPWTLWRVSGFQRVIDFSPLKTKHMYMLKMAKLLRQDIELDSVIHLGICISNLF